ncbi:hypothetical protein ACFL9U_14275, partial [Thermodesulfobacteriota bacterium]
MAKQDTISSTERLLDLIRGKSKPDLESDGSPSLPSSPRNLKSFFSRLKSNIMGSFSFRKTITVGVNIGYHDLRLAEMAQASEKNQELLNHHYVSFPAGISPDSPRFPQFLKSTLTDFCETSGKMDFWSAISSAKVEMRYLRIPRVPKKQIANAVYWTYKKEVSFNENEEIFDFEILGETVIDGTRKIEVMAYSAPEQDVQNLKTTFSKSGYPLAGITIIPFVLQNLWRSDWIESEGKNTCSLYIGRDWSRIDIFSNKNLVVSRGIKAGMMSMIESIRQTMADNYSASSFELEPLDAPTPPEEYDVKLEAELGQARKIFFTFIDEPSFLKETVEHIALDGDKVFDMVLPALERLVRQVDRTLEHYSLNFENQVVSKIYISGPIS